MRRALLLLTVATLFLMACANADPSMPPTTPAADVPPPTAVAKATQPPATAEPPPATSLVISELLVGIPGNNNHEFVELYNPGTEAVDLADWELRYANRDDRAPETLATWPAGALVPPQGHYLLVRIGADLGLLPDAVFDLPLSERKGGLVLVDATGQIVDAVGWNEAPAGFVSGTAVALTNDGQSVERLPGGDDGNATQTANNAADFTAVSPNPQNSGSAPTPLPGQRLGITLDAPETIPPGGSFTYTITVTNDSDSDLSDVHVSVPLADHFTAVTLPAGAVVENGRVAWTIPTLAAGASAGETLALQAPFTYVDTLVSGAFAAADGRLNAFAAPTLVVMAGGAIPIDVARELEGSVVSVEGIATMYTGGFFAGSTGTKFYLEDASGGIQVYVPGGQGLVNVDIGDRVRVTGEIELYRDSMEIIPVEIPADVEILEAAAAEPQPAVTSVLDIQENSNIIGRLASIEGIATRIEEFTYSYEVDLTDELGNTTLVYIDKESGVTAEPLDVGELYRVTGIAEFYSGKHEVLPRLQSDIVQVFPPELRVDVQAANSIQPGETISYTITVANHTAEPLSNVIITAVAPATTTIAGISAGGSAAGQTLTWTLPELAPDGASAQVGYSVTVPDNASDPLLAAPITAVADQWPEPAQTQPYLTFVGDGVPIWAIQGPGERSPYVRSEATTQGIVTGVFPGLQGFWIQETTSDTDPATSAGLFVLFGEAEVTDLPVAAGDLVQVNGRVREISGQTTLHALTPEAVAVLSSDNPLPAVTPFDPPQGAAEALVYKEALEGMLVGLEGTAVAVAPTTQYGETTLVAAHWGVDEVPRGAESGFFIVFDDGSTVRHLDQSTQTVAVQKGDQVSGLVGPLAYTFGQHKIEPVALPEVASQVRPLPALPPLTPNQFSIATFNVENFFDRFDPHPSDPPKPGKSGYEQKLNKLAEAIVAMGAPTIIGMQEVENIGVLEDLAAMPQLGDFDYRPYLIEGPDSRGIDVAYLVRGDRAAVERVEAFPEPTGLTSRPPLLIQAVVDTAGGTQSIYLLNNHFSSLSSGEAATEPRRTGQAAWNVSIMDQIRADEPGALFVVLGDLNSFLATPPLETLRDGGLRHVYELGAEGEPLPYTYIFQGNTQTLDHILVSPELFAQLTGVVALHINADYPLSAPDDLTARRVSDHDPLVAVFTAE